MYPDGNNKLQQTEESAIDTKLFGYGQKLDCIDTLM